MAGSLLKDRSPFWPNQFLIAEEECQHCPSSKKTEDKGLEGILKSCVSHLALQICAHYCPLSTLCTMITDRALWKFFFIFFVVLLPHQSLGKGQEIILIIKSRLSTLWNFL